LVEDNLLSIGRRSAEERVATSLILLYKRTAALGGHTEQPGEGVLFPPTQQHPVDALGLSLAHTNKTMRKLQRRNMFRMAGGRLRLIDAAALAQLADLYGDGRLPVRPLV
jgi:CRP-like cAMP-binding protein